MLVIAFAELPIQWYPGRHIESIKPNPVKGTEIQIWERSGTRCLPVKGMMKEEQDFRKAY